MKVRSFLVVGAGRFGGALARTLFELGHEVVILDEDEEAIERIMAHATHAVVGDATDEETLAQLGAANFDVGIVAIGESFESAVLAVAALRSLGVDRIVAKASSELTAHVLVKVGANEVIRPEHDMGVRLARQLVTPALIDAFALSDAHGVIEIEAGEDLVGSLAHLRLPNRFRVQVIAVERGEALTVGPKADFEVQEGDHLVLIGATEDLDRFRETVAA